MLTLAYKHHLDETLKRLSAFYARRAQDQILVSFQTPSNALRQFARQYQTGYTEYPAPAARIRFWDELLRERSSLEDDSIPSAYHTELDKDFTEECWAATSSSWPTKIPVGSHPWSARF